MLERNESSAAQGRQWVKCPICGEPDMRQEDGTVTCTNLACPSNVLPDASSAATTESRRYRMIRLEKGDYLLPSNDAQILWRIAQYDEDDDTRLWGLWRWDGAMPTVDQIALALDEGMWTDRWEYWDGGYRKRSDVIAYLDRCKEGNS